MTNSTFPNVTDYRDIESINHHQAATAGGAPLEQVLAALGRMSRDNARTPMQWDGSRNAGFSTGQPWLPVNANSSWLNAAAAVADPDSVFHHYRRLIELRHADDTVVLGDFSMLLPDHPSIYAFTRSLHHRTLLVMGNFSGETVDVPLDPDDWAGGEPVIGNYPEPSRNVTDPLRPWESRMHRFTAHSSHA